MGLHRHPLLGGSQKRKQPGGQTRVVREGFLEEETGIRP